MKNCTFILSTQSSMFSKFINRKFELNKLKKYFVELVFPTRLFFSISTCILIVFAGYFSHAQTYVIDTLLVDTTAVYPPIESLGDDVLIENIWMPNQYTGGLPSSGCYNSFNNKYYYYGERRLIIVDGSTHAVSNTIALTTIGDLRKPYVPIGYRSFNNLAYNSINNAIYCTYVDIDGVKLKIFNGSDDMEIASFTKDPGIYMNSYVVYDEAQNKCYWVLNYNSGANDKCKIYKIAYVNGNYYIGTPITINYSSVYDLICSPDGTRLFISHDQGVRVLTQTLTTICDLYIDKTYSLVYNTISNKVYAGRANDHIIHIIDAAAAEPSVIGEITGLPYKQCIQGCFNSADNKVYFTNQEAGDGVTGGYVLIIDENDNLLDPIFLNLAECILYNPGTNKVIAGGSMNIRCIDGSSNQVESKQTFYAKNIILNTSNDQVSALSTHGHVGYYSDNFNVINHRFLGGNIYESCYNSKDNKLYFCQQVSKPSFVAVVDGSDEQVIDTIRIDARILSCTYNSLNNKIFVGGTQTNSYFVIDGASNELTQISLNGQGEAKKMFSGPGNFIYADIHTGTGNSLYIINAQDYSFHTIQLDATVKSFVYDSYSSNQRLFIGLENNKIMVLDTQDYSIIETIELLNVPSSNFILEMQYNHIKNNLYCINLEFHYFTVIDCENYTYSTYNLPWVINENARSIEFSIQESKIYIMTLHYLLVYSSNDLWLLNTVFSDHPSMGMVYNEFNNRLYIHYGYMGTPDVWCKVLSGHNESTVSKIPFNQGGSYLQHIVINLPFIKTYTSTDNKIYFSNFGLSNVSAIQCAPEIRNLNSEITWLSFPRLDRPGNNGVDAQTFLSTNLEPFGPDVYLKLSHHAQPPNNMTDLTHDLGIWSSNNLSDIFSDKGYKLEFANSDPRTITCPGTILDSDHPVNLYGPEKYNWIGYFLTEPRWPQDAFVGIWDKLTLIKTQYWTMMKAFGVWFQTDKVGPIKYGDMVIVKTTEDCILYWNNEASPGTPKGYAQTEYFSYEEQPDYTPIYVEIDTTDLPQEVGVFIDTVCYGAETVIPGDTMVQINAYIDTTGQGEEVDFEFYYANKKSSDEINSYRTFNPVTKRMEPHKINTRDKRDWYWVSFRKTETEEEDIIASEDIEFMYCRPNPFTSSTEISFLLHENANVVLRILSLDGKEIKTLLSGNQKTGEYNISWDGTSDSGLPTEGGIYLVTIRTDKKMITEKLIFMK